MRNLTIASTAIYDPNQPGEVNCVLAKYTGIYVDATPGSVVVIASGVFINPNTGNPVLGPGWTATLTQAQITSLGISLTALDTAVLTQIAIAA